MQFNFQDYAAHGVYTAVVLDFLAVYALWFCGYVLNPSPIKHAVQFCEVHPVYAFFSKPHMLSQHNVFFCHKPKIVFSIGFIVFGFLTSSHHNFVVYLWSDISLDTFTRNIVGLCYKLLMAL